MSGSAVQPEVKSFLTMLVEDIVCSHKKLWAGNQWKNKNDSKRTNEKKNDIMKIMKQKRHMQENAIMKLEKSRCKEIKNGEKRTEKELMNLIEKHIKEIKNGIMSVEGKCSRTILKSIEQDHWLTNISEKKEWIGQNFVKNVEKNVSLMHIMKTIQNLLKSFFFAGNAIH